MSNDKKRELVILVTRASAVFLPPAGSDFPDERAGKCLLPGENQVSKKYWDVVKENPSVKIHLGVDILRNKGVGEANLIVNDFNEITLGQAQDLIEHIEDIDRIHEIKDRSTKKGLTALCKSRIQELLTVNEKKNK